MKVVLGRFLAIVVISTSNFHIKAASLGREAESSDNSRSAQAQPRDSTSNNGMFTLPDCPKEIEDDVKACYHNSFENMKVDFNKVGDEVLSKVDVDKLMSKIDIDAILKRIDWDKIITLAKEKFEEMIGLSIGELVFLILLALWLPPLMIIGCIFLCCWGFRCCCFSKAVTGLNTRAPFFGNKSVVPLNVPGPGQPGPAPSTQLGSIRSGQPGPIRPGQPGPIRPGPPGPIQSAPFQSGQPESIRP